ncbi:MAG: hypothetical protein AAF086_07005, partial [Planctomycetota bacterium]
RGSGRLRRCQRLTKLCVPDEQGRTLFYEYFHGDTGRGCGASHQTGWTSLVTRCIEEVAAGGSVWDPGEQLAESAAE